MSKVVETDVAIFGGGVSGLWLLNRLRQLGYTAILLETGALGGGQTHKAQGIIHGGTKYALQGSITASTQAIAGMPAVWQRCLAGKGDMDLTQVPVLSQHQYLFSTNKLAGKVAGFFAGLALQGTLTSLPREAYPAVFQHARFNGLVYALHEMAIDTHALVRELVKPNQDVIFKINPLQDNDWQTDAAGHITALTVHAAHSEPVTIKARKYIFAAGAGNEFFLKKMPQKVVAAQRRPLHMVVVKTDFAFPVFAHCLGLGAVPRMTITTHKAHDGKNVWYLGGQIAEDGVKFAAEKQIEIARQELQAIFSWLDFSTAEFASFMVDRAEAAQADGKRPDGAYYKEIANTIFAWPTKLALAPKLADEVIACLEREGVKQGAFDTRAMRAFPVPAMAVPVWDELL